MPRTPTTMSRAPQLQNKLKILAAVVTIVVIVIVMFESVVVVQAGHRGVFLYVGAVENRVLGEGIHFIIPFAEQAIQMKVRTLKFQADASAASNDLQEVQTIHPILLSALLDLALWVGRYERHSLNKR